ncbi:MAG: DUF4869 domain-containing protein [Eubacteriales bacterium]|nr:DUF4869 domain-containing protein [Eubacteriales bacterium]
MLKIFFGDNPGNGYIFNTDVFFNNSYEDEWITADISRQMIKDVDGSEVKGGNLIESPYLGPIPPERLSGGVKTLILIAHDRKHIFNGSACGDNCARWMLRLAENQDILIRLGHIMNFGCDPFNIEVVNTGQVVHTMQELDEEVIKNRLLRDEK